MEPREYNPVGGMNSAETNAQIRVPRTEMNNLIPDSLIVFYSVTGYACLLSHRVANVATDSSDNPISAVDDEIDASERAEEFARETTDPFMGSPVPLSCGEPNKRFDGWNN